MASRAVFRGDNGTYWNLIESEVVLADVGIGRPGSVAIYAGYICMTVPARSPVRDNSPALNGMAVNTFLGVFRDTSDNAVFL